MCGLESRLYIAQVLWLSMWCRIICTFVAGVFLTLFALILDPSSSAFRSVLMSVHKAANFAPLGRSREYSVAAHALQMYT